MFSRFRALGRFIVKGLIILIYHWRRKNTGSYVLVIPLDFFFGHWPNEQYRQETVATSSKNRFIMWEASLHYEQKKSIWGRIINICWNLLVFCSCDSGWFEMLLELLELVVGLFSQLPTRLNDQRLEQIINCSIL